MTFLLDAYYALAAYMRAELRRLLFCMYWQGYTLCLRKSQRFLFLRHTINMSEFILQCTKRINVRYVITDGQLAASHVQLTELFFRVE